MPYSTINDVTVLDKSANQQPLQNRFLCVQNSNYNLLITFLPKRIYIQSSIFLLKSEEMISSL